jgi:glycosyltransferase involved in cell wall biosynthesis
MAPWWSARGVEVTLATFSPGGAHDLFVPPPAVRRVALEAGDGGVVQRLARLTRALRTLIVSSRPDAVISFITENNLIALLASTGLEVRTLVSERAHPQFDTTVRPLWRALRWLLYRRASLVIAQTQATAQWVAEHCGARVTVIPNALRTLVDAQHPREPLVLGVGRLTRQKGFDLLLRAFARLRPEFPQWRIAILGVGPELDSLRALAESLRIADAVRFEGTDPAIEGWMARAGLVVQPSRFEGFPNVVLEAMGLGTAVISGDCPAGPSDLITDGRNGLLVPVDDVDGLASAMRKLLSDPSLRERLGHEARHVRTAFSQERIMSMWDSIVFAGARSAGASP